VIVPIVTEPVLVVVIVDERAGFQILNIQKEGSLIGDDSGPFIHIDKYYEFISSTTYHKIQYH
jgi:hypothetical protein